MPTYEPACLNNLKTGDQIAVKGNVVDLNPFLLPFMLHTNGEYFHHGILDKERMEVIDFHEDNKFSAKPKRRSISEFLAGRCQLYRVIHEECLPVEKTMEMANDAVQPGSFYPAYNLLLNNCETFATYLKTGNKRSAQASQAVLNFLLFIMLLLEVYVMYRARRYNQ